MVQMWKTWKAKCQGKYSDGSFDPFFVTFAHIRFLFFLTECGSYGNILDILKDNDIEVNE